MTAAKAIEYLRAGQDDGDFVWQIAAIIEQQAAEIATMKTALKIIAYPMAYLQDYAELQGAELNAMWAMQIIKEPDWYQEKAKEGLAWLEKEAEGVE